MMQCGAPALHQDGIRIQHMIRPCTLVILILVGLVCSSSCGRYRFQPIRDTGRDLLRQRVLTRSLSEAELAVAERKRELMTAVLGELSLVKSGIMREIALLEGILKKGISGNYSCLEFDQIDGPLFDCFFEFSQQILPLLPNMLSNARSCPDVTIRTVASRLSNKLQTSFDVWRDFMDAGQCDDYLIRRLIDLLASNRRALNVVIQAMHDYRPHSAGY